MLKSVSMYISGCLWWGRWVTRDTSEGQLDFSSLVTEGFALKIRINHLPRGKFFHVEANMEIIAWHQPTKYPVGCPRQLFLKK